MNHPIDASHTDGLNKAEFDQLAHQYSDLHAKNITISGESPDFFSEYKIEDLANVISSLKLQNKKILDFGSGIGNSVPYFRKYFPAGKLTCADVSAVSIETAQNRFPGAENYVLIDKACIPLPKASQDIVFSACVFHHIPHEEHQHWLGELQRITKVGGLLCIYEHNPLNPLTVNAVNSCPLDKNARLIGGRDLSKIVSAGGWNNIKIGYKIFFPSALKALRPLERLLEWLPLGAQYRLTARKQM